MVTSQLGHGTLGVPGGHVPQTEEGSEISRVDLKKGQSQPEQWTLGGAGTILQPEGTACTKT